MNKFYIKSQDDLRILIVNTASKIGVSEAVIEKDYWVSFILDYLFNENKWSKFFTFKGGTSLSKCFGLIERFSEDIDLVLDWIVLGYKLNEPWFERSKTQQDMFNKKLNLKTQDFIKNKLAPEIYKDLNEIGLRDFSLSIDEQDAQTILFTYPKIFNSNYLSQNIRLEIGSLAAWTPAIEAEIKPLISNSYPHVFSKSSTIRTVTPERTFWEKATILHHEANRPEKSIMPIRYARHYYDLYKMSKTEIKEKALKDRELLKTVTEFKIKFYPRKWAKYEDVLVGNLRLLPNSYRYEEIKKDYESMREMIYGMYPTFEELITELVKLEKEINS